MSKIKLFNKEILKNKRLLALIFILIGTIFITLGYSYAYFNKVVIGSNVDLRVGTINYSLDSDGLNSNYQTTVSAGSKAVVEVTINGLDNFASKYQMYYTGSNLDDVVVGYANETTDLPSGEMSAKGTKNVILVVQNNSSSDVTVTIGVAGGLSKYTVDDIVLKSGQYKITEELASFDIQLASVTIDGQKANSLPTSGNYSLSGYACQKGSTLEWDTYKKSITFSAGVPKRESCSLEFTTSTDYPLLIDKVKQGDYIAYEGNNGCLRDGVATATVTTSGQGTDENANSCLGYNANANSDGTKDSEYGMYGYSDEGGIYAARYHVSGWRIAYTKDNRAYIISAGSPESITRSDYTNIGYTNFISDANLDAKKYCNSNFVDSCTSDEDVHAINDTDYNIITAQATGTTGGYLYTSISGATKCGEVWSKEVCGYNNDLIDNGGEYWFAAKGTTWLDEVNGVLWLPGLDGPGDGSPDEPNGLRPVIRLSSDIYITGGSGTMNDPYTIVKK